jgi:hypothetical protein
MELFMMVILKIMKRMERVSIRSRVRFIKVNSKIIDFMGKENLIMVMEIYMWAPLRKVRRMEKVNWLWVVRGSSIEVNLKMIG